VDTALAESSSESRRFLVLLVPSPLLGPGGKSPNCPGPCPNCGLRRPNPPPPLIACGNCQISAKLYGAVLPLPLFAKEPSFIIPPGSINENPNRKLSLTFTNGITKPQQKKEWEKEKDEEREREGERERERKVLALVLDLLGQWRMVRAVGLYYISLFTHTVPRTQTSVAAYEVVSTEVWAVLSSLPYDQTTLPRPIQDFNRWFPPPNPVLPRGKGFNVFGIWNS